MARISPVVGIAACMLVLLVGDTQGSCEELDTCSKQGNNKTYSFLKDGYDQNNYLEEIEDICDYSDLQCINDTFSSCSNNSVVVEANIVYGKRDFICSDDGKELVQRIPASYCFHNETATALVDEHRKTCMTTYVTGGVCERVNNVVLCDTNYANTHCGVFSKYLIVESWIVRVRYQFPSCETNITQTHRFPLPAAV